MNLSADSTILSHELIHLLLTSLIALFFWRRFKDKRLILVSFFFGFFIDIDHLFDYFVHFGLTNNFLNFFIVASYVLPNNKVYIFFHGWEFIIVFWLIGFFLEKKFKIKGLSLVILFSYAAHLLWDNFSFHHHPLAYLFLFRLANHFDLKSFRGL